MDTVFIYVYHDATGYDSFVSEIRKVWFNPKDALVFFDTKLDYYKDMADLEVWKNCDKKCLLDFSPNERDKNNFIKTFGL